jgi:hypothetical protein
MKQIAFASKKEMKKMLPIVIMPAKTSYSLTPSPN